MPHKKKKPQTSSNEKETPKPWPNLPKQLLISLAVQPHLLKNITSIGCVIKSWRSSALIEIHGKHPDGPHVQRHHTLSVRFHEEVPYTCGRKSYYDCPERSNIKGCSHGQLLTLQQTTMSCWLEERPTLCYHPLPEWDPRFDFKHAAFISGGFDVMVVTGDCDPAFAICRRNLGGGRAWIMEDCELKEPYAPCQNMRFCNVVELGGRFYALSLQGSVVVVEEEKAGSRRFKITRVGRNRAVPSKGSRQFREYMVESRGEVFVVLLVSRKSIDVVVDVEVFRLDTEKLLWVEVGNIGDRALFLEDECCMWVEASELGFKRNCVYFTHHRVSEWFVFDIELGSILPAFGM